MVREGRLWDDLRGSHLGINFVRRIHRYDCHPAAESISRLELREHGYIQCLGLPSYRLPYADNVLGPGLLIGLLYLFPDVSYFPYLFSFQGAVPKGNATEQMIQSLNLREGQLVFKCARCCCIKPQRAHHCSVCKRCIRKMDHHCPWVDNCVGEDNQKYFVLFTVRKGAKLRRSFYKLIKPPLPFSSTSL